ncbi:MAG: tetratricopeptide repeat protein, partial [Hyphomicrobiaceae bacterium]
MIAARIYFILLTLVIVVNSHGAARADALAGHDCFANDAMLRIRGCTELLQRDHLDPVTRSTALATRALGLSIIGRYKDAIRDYDRALKIIPNYPVALNNRAWALFKLGRVDEAAPDVEKSLRLDPTSPHAYDTRAHVRHWQGRSNAALGDYRKAMQLGGPRMVKLYQCGLKASGHFIGPVTGIITDQLDLALKECVKSTKCDPLPPDEECKA